MSLASVFSQAPGSGSFVSCLRLSIASPPRTSFRTGIEPHGDAVLTVFFSNSGQRRSGVGAAKSAYCRRWSSTPRFCRIGQTSLWNQQPKSLSVRPSDGGNSQINIVPTDQSIPVRPDHRAGMIRGLQRLSTAIEETHSTNDFNMLFH